MKMNRVPRLTKKYVCDAIFMPGLWLCIALLIINGPAMGDISLVVNPYEGVDWDNIRHHKINLHTHTTESDGRMTPAQVIDEYHKRGYSGLMISDHNRSTWSWSDYGRIPEALGMVAIPGNELSRHHHALSLFTNYETDSTDLEASLVGVSERGGIATLCHPAMHWVRESDKPGLKVAFTPQLRAIAQGDFTVATWFRTTDSGRHILLGNFSPNYSGALNLELHTENRVRLYLQPHGNGKTVDLNVSADEFNIKTRDGEWHHLAGIRRLGTVYLYLDGQLVGERTDSAGAFELQGNVYYIGRDSRTDSTALNGDLCQASIWGRALSDAEVNQLFINGTMSGAALLAQYACSATVGEDSAENSDGPYPAEKADVAPAVISDIPECLKGNDKVRRALHFGVAHIADTVPADVVAKYAAIFRRHPYLVGTEILNCTRPLSEYPLDRGLWDGLLTTLMPERPVWGLAVDDMHSIQHLGGNWLVIPVKQLDVNAVRTALETGRYYFSSIRYEGLEHANAEGTPIIENVDCNKQAKQITVTATVAGKPVADAAYTWISNGNTIHTGPTLSYGNNPKVGAYARVEIKTPSGISYSNPFGFVKK